ncbi:MAG: phosphoglycolate phosphatase [Halioglobus sp.]|jgi:phosphoglycolate phosphatase
MNLVFDLDGTLIDSAPDIQCAASNVLDGVGKEKLTLSETRSFIGEGAAVFVQKMMEAREIDDSSSSHQSLLEQFLTQYELGVDKAEFYPGVMDALAALKGAGHRMGLCTNKAEGPTRAVLRYMELEPVFDAVMSGGMIASRKPEPDMLLQTIQALGAGPTLYVGDSEVDAETAKRAQVPFALYSEGYRKVAVSEMDHDWLFNDFEQLQGIVAQAMRAAVK